MRQHVLQDDEALRHGEARHPGQARPDARKSQQEAKDEFKTALERFKAVVEVDGGALEDKYTTLKRELERSEDHARKVHDRIKQVRDVSDDLFKEWDKESASTPIGATGGERTRTPRHRRGRRADRGMKRAAERIEPVLKPLRDRVLFLKHNLNARAIGALEGSW